MSESALCFTCGLPIGDPPRLNHTPDGQTCPSCRDRLLDCLPAALPRQPWEVADVLAVVEDEEVEEEAEALAVVEDEQAETEPA